MQEKSSIFERDLSPISQAVIVVCGAIMIMLISKIIEYAGLMHISPRFYWVTAGALIFYFGIFNSIFSLSTKEMNNYWLNSFYSYTGVVLGLSCMAWVFSGMSINEAGSFRWIYIVLTFGYLLFLSMLRFMRKIVIIAQRDQGKFRGED